MKGLQQYTQIIEDISNIKWLTYGTWTSNPPTISLSEKPSHGLIYSERWASSYTSYYVFLPTLTTDFYIGDPTLITPATANTGTGLYQSSTSATYGDTIYYILSWQDSRITFSLTTVSYSEYYSQLIYSTSKESYMPISYIFWKEKD